MDDGKNHWADYPESTYALIESFVGFLSKEDGKKRLTDAEWESVASAASAVHHRTLSAFECSKRISEAGQTILFLVWYY